MLDRSLSVPVSHQPQPCDALIVPRNVRSVGVDMLFLEIRLPADSPTPALRIHQPFNAQLHPKYLRLAKVLLLPLQVDMGFLFPELA